MRMRKLEIKELSFLNHNNPWVYNTTIRQIIKEASAEKLQRILIEVGTCYLSAWNRNLRWYFEEEVTLDKNSPELANQEYGERWMGMVDWIMEGRRKMRDQYLEDVKKIYALCMERAREFGADFSKYPEKLEELTN